MTPITFQSSMHPFIAHWLDRQWAVHTTLPDHMVKSTPAFYAFAVGKDMLIAPCRLRGAVLGMVPVG